MLLIAGLCIHIAGLAILFISFDKEVSRDPLDPTVTVDCGTPAAILLRRDSNTPRECREEASRRARTAGGVVALAFVVGAGGLLLTRLRLRRQFR